MLGGVITGLLRPSPAITGEVEGARVRYLLSLQLLLLSVGYPIVFALRWGYPRLGNSYYVGLGGLTAMFLCFLVTRTARWRLGGLLSSFTAIATGLVLAAIDPADGTWPITSVLATILASAFLSTTWTLVIGALGIVSTTAMVLLHPGFDTFELMLPPLTIQAASIPLVILAGWQRRQVEELRFLDLQRHRKRLADAQSLAKMGSWSLNPATGETFVSDQALQYLSSAAFAAAPIETLIGCVAAGHQEQLRRELSKLMAGEGKGAFAERLPLKEDSSQIVSLSFRRREDEIIEGTIQDVSNEVQAERERQSLERALSDARRLETVGRMAGGVAHDFNNLLTVILTSNQLLQRKYEDERFLREIEAAGEHGRELIKQLLAFAGRQSLKPKRLRPGPLIDELQPILERLVGENIELHCEGLDSSAEVEVDPVQLEQVLLNLVVNARDAMPEGGTIHIELNATAGDAPSTQKLDMESVCLTVRDSGEGMPPEVVEKVFEPFFTTKDEGKGTGLGLATVDGIIRQSGGALELDSTPGEGTEFRIYLPRSRAGTPSTSTVIG